MSITFDAESARRMTDDVLFKLLKRVGARQHTTHISLTGCFSVSGHGLKPLQKSTVLTSIDLPEAPP